MRRAWTGIIFCGVLLFFLLPVPVCRAAQRNGAFTNGEAERLEIALTFDDGPHPRYTREILSVLEEYGIKATFFFVGQNVAYYPETAKAVAEGGHEIGNHTYTHPHLKKTGDPQLYAEISQTQKIIEDITGQSPFLFRPPEGFLSAERNDAIQKSGLYSILWSVDTYDWKGTSAAEIARIVSQGVRGGDVILCHDYVGHPTTTVAALRQFIPELLSKGYRFVTVSELLAKEGYSIPPSVANSSEPLPESEPSASSESAASDNSSGCSA